MAGTWRGMAFVGLGLAWCLAAPRAAAQTAGHPAFRSGESGYQRTSGFHNPAMEYFGKSRPQFYARQEGARPAVAPAAAAAPLAGLAQKNKPFANVRTGPTISPYLGLDIRESGVGLPNYYAFVRPQLDQQQQNGVQQAQYQRLQRQFNAAAGGSAFTREGMSTTGHATQFLNAGGYYPQTR